MARRRSSAPYLQAPGLIAKGVRSAPVSAPPEKYLGVWKRNGLEAVETTEPKRSSDGRSVPQILHSASHYINFVNQHNPVDDLRSTTNDVEWVILALNKVTLGASALVLT